MSVTALAVVNAIADVAILGLLAFVMRGASFLRPHGRPERSVRPLVEAHRVRYRARYPGRVAEARH
jgi:hypothetical protein